MTTAAERFHEHLDKCAKCNGNPFDMCPVGKALIEAAAKELPQAFPTPATREREGKQS